MPDRHVTGGARRQARASRRIAAATHACAMAMRRVLLAAVLLVPLWGCSAPERLFAVPAPLTTRAGVLADIPNTRFWLDDMSGALQAEAVASVHREEAYRAKTGRTGPLPAANFLAVSGGGDNGAFGAGLLVGWTKAGTRQEFKYVTGVSTGALIAPLAFMGSEYDNDLRRAYTEISQKDVMRKRWITAAIFNDGMADNTPLFELVSTFVTPDLLSRIGEEYHKGRLLFIGTTDLDSQRPVIWNMTAIAASGQPESLDLFRKILVASAAIPGVFPPVMIEVEADGKTYSEMHVDGGTVAQVFLYPASLHVTELSARYGAARTRNAYIIRNAQMKPDWRNVERRTTTIAGRAVGSLLTMQGIGDLYRLYLTTQRDGVDYNLAMIGNDFDAPHPDQFDRGYMNALFNYGYQKAVNGYKWEKYPPGYTP